MIKKILGLLFIAIAIILGLATLAGIPETIRLFLTVFSDNSGYTIGYFIGNLFTNIIFIILVVFLFKLGLKWLKPKKNNQKEIDHIGKK